METIFEYILFMYILPIEFSLLDYVWKTYNLLLPFRFDITNKIGPTSSKLELKAICIDSKIKSYELIINKVNILLSIESKLYGYTIHYFYLLISHYFL